MSVEETPRLLAKVLGGASIKSLCHGNRTAYAVVSQVVKRRALLERALLQCGWEGACTDTEHSERLLLAHDLLFGRGLRRRGQVQKPELRARLLKWQSSLVHAAKANQRLLPGTGSEKLNASLEAPRLPRYARVNTLVSQMDGIITSLTHEGFVLTATPLDANLGSGPAPGHFWRDRHVKSLLVFPAGCELHRHQLVVGGALILQDKASCFPPAALMPKPGAPGMSARRVL